jgi:hypothetical protein
MLKEVLDNISHCDDKHDIELVFVVADEIVEIECQK